VPGDSKTTLSYLTGEALLAEAFDRLRPRSVAMLNRRISTKLAARIDPEGVVHEAFLRARPRWRELEPKPADLDAWVYGQVLDRFKEVARGALGPQHDVGREVPAEPLADHLVDSQTGPNTALSRSERREMVREALEKLDPKDREILALRYFDGLNYSQIGSILGLKAQTANVRALRAAVKLRNLIPPAFRPPAVPEP
jgi:RNA polymerase sigma-70 factor (ECF subfamily)